MIGAGVVARLRARLCRRPMRLDRRLAEYDRRADQYNDRLRGKGPLP